MMVFSKRAEDYHSVHSNHKDVSAISVDLLRTSGRTRDPSDRLIDEKNRY